MKTPRCRSRGRRLVAGLLLAIAAWTPLAAGAGQVRVAAASNFSATLRALIAEFQAGSSHRVVVSQGSTGKP